MRHNYIRLRGRTWFLTLYGILSTLFVGFFVIYCTILFDFLIRVLGGYLTSFGSYLQTNVWQSSNLDDVLNMPKQCLCHHRC
uniref:Prothoracicotropic hormone n=1 Tax=Drosophila melanogaster TaxID=7227 RepID=Q24467_DROME|nr:prothoracicotropic hormone [Drosophila melanogaster]